MLKRHLPFALVLFFLLVLLQTPCYAYDLDDETFVELQSDIEAFHDILENTSWDSQTATYGVVASVKLFAARIEEPVPEWYSIADPDEVKTALQKVRDINWAVTHSHLNDDTYPIITDGFNVGKIWSAAY